MKRHSFITLAVTLPLFLLLLTACHQKKESGDTRTTFEKYLTNEDSLKVLSLVNDFFFLAEQGDYASAAAMLYKVDPEVDLAEPEPLDNEEMAGIVSMLRTLGIQDHRIDYVKFNRSHLNEVKCTAVLIPATDGMPEATTSFYFKPVDYIDSWVLCLMHSESGDEGFVSEDEKAKLKLEYQADQVERARKQAQAEEELKAEQQASSEQPQ